MYSVSNNERYRKLKQRREQKKRVKQTILQTMFVAVLLIAAVTYILPAFPGSTTNPDSNDFYQSNTDHADSLSVRSLLSDPEVPETTIPGYPDDLFSKEQIRDGAWLLYLMGMMYTFIAIALVCDEWFVPAIEEIVERMGMTHDIAGATWMAAGGSAPELFTNIIAVFIARSNMGFGTIVGSAVFNVLFVIGCCAIATPGTLPLTWWPFARDCVYYICSLSVLAGFYSDDEITWWEATILLMLYVGYALIMTQNQKLHRWAHDKLYHRDRPRSKSGSGGGAGDRDGDELGNGDGVGDRDEDHRDGDGKRAVAVQSAMNGVEDDDDGKAQMLESGGSGGGGGGSWSSSSSLRAGGPGTASSTVMASAVHFHASFYDFLTADSSMAEQMGVHVVARMKGTTRETFNAIDRDGNGFIDRQELKEVLRSLGEQFNDKDLAVCFSEIDENGDGQISFMEFERWYLASSLRMRSDIKSIFLQFDDNGDGHIDCHELRTLLRAMNSGLDHELTEQEVVAAMEAMGKTVDDKLSESEFVDWYASTPYFEQKTLKRQETLKEVEEDEGNGIELDFPERTCPRIWFVVTAPIMYSLYFTLPDVQKERRKHLWPLTFVGSMLWLMFYSYLMVWWATRVGQGWSMNEALMGLTFVAAGTSVPDLLSSVIVAKLGRGDMAVSSSIGSNIFDILIGLPAPWLVFALSHGGTYAVEAGTLFSSLLLLMIMLVLVLIAIIANGWKLTHRLGWSMFVLWVLFVTHQVLSNMDCCKALAPL